MVFPNTFTVNKVAHKNAGMKNAAIGLLLLFSLKASSQTGQDSSVNNNIYISTAVEKVAEFPGGQAAFAELIKKNINWPGCCDSAYKNNVQGKVWVKFIIEKDGSVSTVEVVKFPVGGEKMRDEAIRVIKLSPNWTPAEQGGQKVRMMFSIPINFTISDSAPPKKKKKH